MAAAPAEQEEWQDVLRWLVAEILEQQLGLMPGLALMKLPLTLTTGQWTPILLATCFRLGWVSEGSSSERLLKGNIQKAIGRLGWSNHSAFNLEEVTAIFEQLRNAGRPLAEGIGPCPASLLRKTENDILQAMLLKRQDSAGVAASLASSMHTGRRKSGCASSAAGTRSTRRSFSTRSSASARAMSEKSLVARSTSSNQPSQLVAVEAVPPGRQGNLSIVPQLPSGLEDMSRDELKKLLINHHAEWMRAANQLVASPSEEVQKATKLKMKKFRKLQRKRGNYWKKKAKSQKKKLTEQMDRLVAETNPYMQSKRRKSTSFRMRLSTFGGLLF